VKQVCSKYFQHYECDLEELRLRTAQLELKYKDWSKVLIEPATMNDARVFSLESRMTELEDIRIREFDFLKDLMKKLAYSLEQSSVQHLDFELPRLMTSPRSDTQQSDITMLKRMNFIRATLDQHNPTQVT